MVLLFSVISTVAQWLYYNLYDYFVFLSGMYVTVIALDEVVNHFDPESDTEDVFEEAEEEFLVNAPLARPEEFGEFRDRFLTCCKNLQAELLHYPQGLSFDVGVGIGVSKMLKFLCDRQGVFWQAMLYMDRFC